MVNKCEVVPGIYSNKCLKLKKYYSNIMFIIFNY